MQNYFTWSLVVFLLASNDIRAQNLQWAKSVGSKITDISYAITVDENGNSYTTGVFSAKTDLDPGLDSFLLFPHGARDIYILKLDNNGNFIWAKQIGGKANEYASAIAVNPTGYIYLTGSFRDTVDFDPSSQESILIGSDKAEVFLAKYDFDGNFIWANKVTRSLDTAWYNYSYGVSVDPLGNVIVIGSFGTKTDFNPGIDDEIRIASGEDDIFLSKYDAFGNFTWVKNIGGLFEQEPYAIAVDGQGNIFCTGIFSHDVDFDPGPLTHILTAQDTFPDAFILKLNSTGEFNWVKQVSGPATEFGYAIAVDQNGNSYTGGSYSSLTDFNYGGNPVMLPVDSFITVDVDGFILALDADGNFRWVKRITGPDAAEVFDIATSPAMQGGVYAIGLFFDEIKVDDVGIPPITALNNSGDIFFSKLNHDGQFSFLASIGGTVFDYSQAIAVNSSASPPTIYSTGIFSGACDFDPGPNEFPLSTAGSSDIYVLKLNDFITGLKYLPQEQEIDIDIYPNPAFEELEINIPLKQKASIRLLNSFGIEIESMEVNVEDEMVHLDVSLFPSGIYFLQLKINNQLVTRKFIIAH